MRVNLLPRERRQVSLFGSSLDLDFLKRTVGFAALIAALFGLTVGVQLLRLELYRRAAGKIESQLEIHDHLRRHIAMLARDVALLQRIDESSRMSRDSGNGAAVEIVRIGNAIPAGVWLDSLERVGEAYLLSGGAHGLDSVADTLRALQTGTPRFSAALMRLEQSRPGETLRFTIRVPLKENAL